MKLKNKATIITGASQGFGANIAKHFVRNGASVLLCARNYQNLQNVQSELKSYVVDDEQKIEIRSIDVSNKNEVQGLISEAIKVFDRIDVFVNNAGIHGPLGTIDVVDLDEWEKAIYTNMMGMVYTTHFLIPHFKQNNYGKIINVAGGGANTAMPTLSAYAASKAAITRLTENFALEFRQFNIDINAINPGTLLTDMNKTLLNNGRGRISDDVYSRVSNALHDGGDSIEKASLLAVYLASEDSDGFTGKLINAARDPWEKFDQYKDRIMNSDIYNLRRVRLEGY